ncbi:ABC-type glycerol-3-phosphate transport system, substrate-binding protein [Ruminococcaceae bacterium YRB3002]|nr:ABC-type glycerol-3-phosphate transport system, substrate-binding protein [Ruminococcaceae bacterium YRB3002]
MRRIRTAIAAILTASFLMSLMSCKNDDEPSGSATLDMRAPDYVCGNENVDDLYFTSKICTLPFGSTSSSTAVFRRGDDICVMMLSKDENYQPFEGLCVINSDGELLSSQRVDNSDLIETSDNTITDIDGQYMAGIDGYRGAVMFFDYEGNTVDTIEIGEDAGRVCSLIDLDDGFAVCSQTCAIKFDDDRNEVARIDFDSDTGALDDPFMLVQKGNLFLSTAIGFYKLDFDTGSTQYFTKQTMYDGENVFGKAGDFVFSKRNSPAFELFWGSDYYWETDIEAGEIYKVAKRSNIMQVPPRAACPWSYDDNWVCILDKEHFVMTYHYEDYDFMDIVLISADRDADYSQREKITIQGNNIFHDDSIRRAAYLYNTSQHEYYVELQTCGIFEPNSREEETRFLMDVMSEYQNGNTPDIFYGNMFDYLYWGSSGMVTDMSPYLEPDNDIFPGVKSAMTDKDGHIYQVFSSFRIHGLWGRQSDFGNADLTVEELMRLPLISDGGLSITSYGLLYGMLRYNLRDLYVEGKLTRGNVADIVNTVMLHGTNDYTGGTEVSGDDYQRVIDLSDLIEESASNAADYWSIQYQLKDIPVFIGYPSSNVQVRVMEPQGLVALSSSASDPQACCDFISFMLSDEFQSYVALYQGFPVNKAVYERHLGYLKDPSSIPEDIRFMYEGVLMKEYSDVDRGIYKVVPMDSRLADTLLKQVESANTVPVYDWGIGSIISEELQSYYSQGKTVDEMADALYSRLLVYAQENYG